MRKIAMSLAAATILVGGLAGCGDNNTTEGQGMNELGYGTLNHSGDDRTTARYRGEGPITDMLTPDDRQGFGARSYRGNQNWEDNNWYTSNSIRGQGRNAGSEIGNRGLDGQGMSGKNITGNTRMSRAQDGTAMNDRSRVGNNRVRMVDEDGFVRNGREGQRTANYSQSEDAKMARQMENKIENIEGVRDARVIVYGNDVVIGIETNNRQQQEQLEERVRSSVAPLTEKNVHVVSDTRRLQQIRTMGDRLDAGAAIDEVGATFTDMVNDIGRAVQRPFERSR